MKICCITMRAYNKYTAVRATYSLRVINNKVSGNLIRMHMVIVELIKLRLNTLEE